MARKDFLLHIHSDISSSVVCRQLDQVKPLEVCIKVSGAADTPEGQDVIQKNVDKLQE